MGNCIDLLLSPPPEKIRVLIFNGGEEEFMASTTVEEITSGPYHGYKLVHHAQPHSPLSPDSRLISGEVYYLLPHLTISCSPPVSQKMAGDDGCNGGLSIKVVVTKKQLEELLSNSGAMGFPSTEEFANRVLESFPVEEGCAKWRPSLDTIPESRVC